MKDDVKIINCYGCGALVDNIAGKPHKYIGAVQGCWNLYGQVLAKEYYEYNYPVNTHRLTTDTYAVQHPGQPCRQAIQSVNVHLAGLYFVFIENLSGKDATKKMGVFLTKKPKFEWLEPPIPNGQKTVIDVLRAANQKEHEKLVKEWAESVWTCWYFKHKEAIENLMLTRFGEN
jgi:hypothetical protein